MIQPMTAEERTINVRVNLGDRSYDIRVTSDDLAGVGPFARERTAGGAAFVVTDEHVTTHAEVVRSALEAAGCSTRAAVLPPGETLKCLAAAADLYDRLAEAHADRRTLI